MNLRKVVRWTRAVSHSVMLCVVGIPMVHAQQQIPPKASELSVRKPIDASKFMVEKHEAFKAELFKDVTLSPAQQMTVIGNLGALGCAPMSVRQYTRPEPPALASSDACHANYAGTPQELLALRKVITNLIPKNKHKPTDVNRFEAGIPKDCPDKELYYYLDVLAHLTGEQ